MGLENGVEPDEDSLLLNCGELERRRGEVDGLEARRLGVVVTAGADTDDELEVGELGANDENAKLSLPAAPSPFVEGVILAG